MKIDCHTKKGLDVFNSALTLKQKPGRFERLALGAGQNTRKTAVGLINAKEGVAFVCKDAAMWKRIGIVVPSLG